MSIRVFQGGTSSKLKQHCGSFLKQLAQLHHSQLPKAPGATSAPHYELEGQQTHVSIAEPNKGDKTIP